jgi:MFS family permease
MSLSLPNSQGLPRTFWLLLTGAFINRLGGFVVPFLAIYLTQERGLAVERVGLILSLHGVGSLFAGPLGGYLADRVGRRLTLTLALGLGAAAMVHLGFARTPVHIGVAAVLLGLMGELYRPAVSAAIADVVPPDDRMRAFGLLYWAINLGFTVATSLAGVLSGFGFGTLFAADAATTCAYAAIVWVFVKETRPPSPPVAPGERTAAGSVP